MMMVMVVFCYRKYRLINRPRRAGSGVECMQCNLVFDNNTLLDLHMLAHTATTGEISLCTIVLLAECRERCQSHK